VDRRVRTIVCSPQSTGGYRRASVLGCLDTLKLDRSVDTLRRRYTRESATLLRAEGSRGDISTGPPKPLRARSLTDKVSTYKGRPTLSGTVSEVTA
jgi:hypothetical protein